MGLEPEFWSGKTLAQMNPEEWEALCDGCGRCAEACTGKIAIRDVLKRAVDES